MKTRNSSVTNGIQSVDTRWNSSYFMIHRLYEILDAVNVVLLRNKHDIKLFNPDEVGDWPDILKLMKPIANVTNDMSEENYCSVINHPLYKRYLRGINERRGHIKMLHQF